MDLAEVENAEKEEKNYFSAEYFGEHILCPVEFCTITKVKLYLRPGWYTYFQRPCKLGCPKTAIYELAG